MNVGQKDILVKRIEDSARVVFKYSYDKAFIRACDAMALRGLIKLGANPIKVPGLSYNAWYADIDGLNENTYADYAMLVRDFYTQDIRDKFDVLFPEVHVNKVKASVHNPNGFMEAHKGEVEALIEKYRNTTSPLEFYGSKHMAEGVVLFKASVTNKFAKGVINADEQGMAKTAQAIIAALESGKRNILVVAPKTVKMSTWPFEIKRVDKHMTVFLADHKKYGSRAQWTLIHWDCLRLLGEDFIANAGTFDLLIADEFHRCANRESQRSQVLSSIADKIPHVWGLTGTPLTKRPRNLINLLKILKHPFVSTEQKEWEFLKRYCGDKVGQKRNAKGELEGGFWDFSGAKNVDELHELLRDVFIRREKSSTNLPPKINVVKKIELTAAQRKTYNETWDKYCERPDVKEKLKNPTYPASVVKKGQLRKAVSLIKVPYIIEWAEELLEAGEKVCIYTDFTEVFDAYMKHFGSAAVGINGSTTADQRARNVTRFQTDPTCTVFVGNIKAAGEGITLTAASYLAFNDITWLPGDQLQASDRIHRGSQTKTCMIYFFLAEDTEDIPGFKDFIAHKNVVERVVNRRDEFGNLTPTTWTGDTKGIGLENKAVDIKAKPVLPFRRFASHRLKLKAK